MTPTRGEHRKREGAEQREPSDGIPQMRTISYNNLI